jgi:hypothetical protein
MGLGCAGSRRDAWLRSGPAGAIDTCPNESVLKSADRRGDLVLKSFDQLEAD